MDNIDESLTIYFDNSSTRETINILQKDGTFEQIPLYTGEQEGISGYVKLTCNKKKNLRSLNLRVELVGVIEHHPFQDIAATFLNLAKSIEIRRVVEDVDRISFAFEEFPKKYETYSGNKLRIRYYLKAILFNGSSQITEEEQSIGVQKGVDLNRNMRMYEIQVGVPDAIDIQLELSNVEYYLDEAIIGKVTFHMLKVDLTKVELVLIKREACVVDNKEKVEDEIVTRVEMKQGHPKKGEIIPLKVYLSHLNLTPTITRQEENITVTYFLKIGLCNKFGPAFFRRVEVKLYRRENENQKKAEEEMIL